MRTFFASCLAILLALLAVPITFLVGLHIYANPHKDAPEDHDKYEHMGW